MIKLKNIFVTVLIIVLGSASAYYGYRLAYKDLIFPSIKIAGINVTGLSKEAASKLISGYFESNPNSISLYLKGKEVSKLNELQVRRDINWAVEQAYGVGRSGNILTQISDQTNTLINDRSIEIPVIFDKVELNDTLDQISEDSNHKPKWPSLAFVNGKATFIKGEDGIEIKKDDLEKQIITDLSLPGKQRIDIPTVEVSTKENSEIVNEALSALEKWKDQKLMLKFRDFEMKMDSKEMIDLFGLINDPINNESFARLVEEIKPQVETDPKDAVLQFDNNKVNEFKPEVVGATIDLPTFKDKLSKALLAGNEASLDIPVILTYPKIKAGDINNLGIKELIGTGKSSFSHSIPGRVFNVDLAASRIKGTVVAPGEEFSFNDAVGEISKTTGYQSAYVISEGKTVLGDGGGVCQVSTTTFRAALSAGLPITERKAHAYRVGYYEQDSAPGIDATIFSPSADLKFLNNTGHHILIQTSVDTKNLTMRVDIYGTSDGRKSTISKPVISNQTPPPPTLYVDDPTLPLGTMKQVDFSAWGAKVSFNYKVERGGETIYEKTFTSNYQPWQAIYMKGTGGLALR